MALGGGNFAWTQIAEMRERIIVGVLMVATLFLASSVFWSPQQAKLDKVSRDTNVLKRKEQALLDMITELEEKGEAQEKQESTAILPSISRDDPRFAPYLRGELKERHVVIQEVVQALTSSEVLQGVSIVQFAMGEPEDEESYQKVSLELDIEGPFGATIRYLDNVESLPVLVVHDNIAVATSPNRREILNTTLNSTLYVVKSAEALKAEQRAAEAAQKKGK